MGALRNGSSDSKRIWRRAFLGDILALVDDVLVDPCERHAFRIEEDAVAALGADAAAIRQPAEMQMLSFAEQHIPYAAPYADSLFLHLLAGKVPFVWLAPDFDVFFETIRCEPDLFPLAFHARFQMISALPLFLAQFLGSQDSPTFREPALVFDIMIQPIQKMHGMLDDNVVASVHQSKAFREELVALFRSDDRYCDSIHAKRLLFILSHSSACRLNRFHG